jgi:hypothetical protein
VRLNRFDDVFLVRFAEMFFHLLHAVQAHRLGQIQTHILRFPALVFDPLLYHLFVAHDLDARFVGVKRQARKTFGVQFAQLVLIIVMIRRSQHGPADAALSHERVLAFGRFGGGALSLVEGHKMLLQHMRHGFLLR